MDDRDAPAQLWERFQAAWNEHDMTAFAALFHPDVTFVNRVGQYWRGRDEVVKQHAAIHATIYRDMTVGGRVRDADMIADGVAVVHVLTHANFGPAMTRGPREISTLFTYVATRRDGAWRIQAGSNVGLVDPLTGKPIVEK